MDKLEKQPCPLCHKKTLTLIEDSMEVPFFGKAYLFSMKCGSCDYFMSEVEAEQEKEPVCYTFEISSDKDMKVRIVKSSGAIVKFPQLKMSMQPGPSSIGFVTNIEGLLNRFKEIIEKERDDSDDEEIKKKAKGLLKKIWKIKLGDMKVKVIIEDKTGNSAIISEKAKVEKLKK
ncbi:MAG: ZPR1 zinc finger domain-containing protein [Candidatus Woesearchaeota archaeon]